MPPDDAFVVKKLRAAGAIVLAKVNMSEFASGPARSSLGGQSLNPHDLTRTPSGSSGGTGVAIAAAYAPLGMGTDTGGSIRGPSTSNGIVGLKPTHGLLSRSGIIPLSLTFDTGGPMARSVTDVAIALGIMTGVDPSDAATAKSQGKFESDYSKYLKADGLKGARIGIARDFLGGDPDVDWVMDASLDAMRKAGATIVDVRYPKWLLDSKQEFYNAIRRPEFHVQIAEYLKTTGPGYPKTLEEMIERSNALTAVRADGAAPNPGRWTLFKREAESGALEDYRYTAVRDHGLPMVRAAVEGVLAAQRLDAIVYPTSPRRPGMIAESGARRRRNRARVGDRHREPHRLSRPDRPGRLHRRQPAGRDLVLRPGVQRAQAAVARFQFRAGHPRAPPARAHTGAARRGDHHSVARRRSSVATIP